MEYSLVADRDQRGELLFILWAIRGGKKGLASKEAPQTFQRQMANGLV